MTFKTKIYIGIAAAIIIAISATAFWQSRKITALEHTVDEAKQTADQKRQAADAKELEAAEYKQKIEYLEQQLSEIQTTARKQDEKLEKLNVNSRNARASVERAKRVRTIPAATVELCEKLAEVGHACE